MDGTTSGLSATEMALLSNNGMDQGDMSGMAGMGGMGGSWMWIFCLFILFFGFGGNGFGANSSVNAQGGYVTNAQMNNALQFESLQTGNKDILGAIQQNTYDTVNALKDSELRLQNNLASVQNMETAINDQMQSCCCNILRGIDSVNANTAQGIAQLGYQNALNTASINENTTAQTQKILDAISGNRIADMQNQINQLQLQNAVAGVVRYPQASTYYAGMNPFCGCNCGSI